jgi:hypothetical protein
MAAHGGTTTDHREIRRWAEARGAQPSRVAHTEAAALAGDPRIIRLDLPGYSDAGALEPITWDEWFRTFDEHKLAFVYQDTTADGEPSNVSRIVRRAAVAARVGGDAHASARTTGAAKRGATKPAVEQTAAKKATPERTTGTKPARRAR